ncbi:hypothetical protein F5883DRAFT_590406 [Diaporthe sp. PMI_573]|nr:hypothetical protein F5883DRAFT_590406 [Diaporthaceae sp. PMI_573]
MERMPPEIILEILRNVSKRDVKSTRLVWGKVNPIASPILFTRVYASLHLKDLEVLSAISEHPTLKDLVQEVVYSGVFFHKSEIRDERWSLQPDFERGRQYYLARVEEEEMTLQDRRDEAVISAALARMPNIRSVIFTNHWRPARGLVGDFHAQFSSSVHPPEGARFGGPLSRAYPLFAKQPCGLPLRIGDCKSGGISIDHGFKVMCRALSIANLTAQALSVDYCNDFAGSRGITSGISAGSLLFTPRDWEHSCNAFRQLRKVAFGLCMGNTDDEWDIVMQGNLAKLLAEAKELEELTFDFTRSAHSVPLAKCLGTHSWPCLRTIRLFRKEMDQAELVALVQRHGKTLKVLHLEEINLTSGTWLDAAEEMRRWLALESVSFSWLGERIDEWNVKKAITDELENYMLHGTSDPIYEPNYYPGTPTRFTTASIV